MCIFQWTWIWNQALKLNSTLWIHTVHKRCVQTTEIVSTSQKNVCSMHSHNVLTYGNDEKEIKAPK